MGGRVFDGQMHELAGFVCYAAIELDHLSLGEETDLTNLRRVKDWLAENLQSTSEYSTTPLLLVRCALINCHQFGCKERLVAKLIEKADSIRHSLSVICEIPAHYQDCHLGVIEKQKEFCLELSKAATAEFCRIDLGGKSN